MSNKKSVSKGSNSGTKQPLKSMSRITFARDADRIRANPGQYDDETVARANTFAATRCKRAGKGVQKRRAA